MPALRSAGPRHEALSAGIRPALVAVASVLLIVVVARLAGERRVLPFAGLVLSGAAVVGLSRVVEVPGELILGLVGLGTAGLVVTRLGLPSWAVLALALPGAALVSLAFLHEPLDPDVASYAALGDVHAAQLRLLTAAAIVVGSPLVYDFDRRSSYRGTGPLLVAISAAGILTAVPETKPPIVLLGAALPLGVLACLRPSVSLGGAGACATVGVVVWCAATGGVARPAPILVGLGSLGLLLVEPMSTVVARGRSTVLNRPASGRWTVPALGAAHLCLVVVTTRVAGLQPAPMAAAVIVAALTLTSVAVALAGWTRDRAGVRARGP